MLVGKQKDVYKQLHKRHHNEIDIETNIERVRGGSDEESREKNEKK